MATFFPLPCFFALFIPPLPRDGVISGTASSNTLCLGTGYRACLDASPMAAAFWVSFFVVVTLFTATLMAWNTARARERRRAQRTLDGLTSAGIRELAELRGPGSAVSPVYFASEECLWRARLGVQMVVQGAPLQPDDPRLDVLSSYSDQDPRLWWSLALTGHIVSFVELPSALDAALCSRFPVRGGRTMHLGAVRPDERVAGDTWPPECGKRVPGLWAVVQWDYVHASTERSLRALRSRLHDTEPRFKRVTTSESRVAWALDKGDPHAWVSGTADEAARASASTTPTSHHNPITSSAGTNSGAPVVQRERERHLPGVPTLSLLPMYTVTAGEHFVDDDYLTLCARSPHHAFFTAVYGLDAACGALHCVPSVHPLEEDSDQGSGFLY